MRHLEERRAVLETARRMNASGLNQGTSGNVSLRVDGGLLITPSGLPYDETTPEDIVEMDLKGGVRAGQREPSSEWRIHRDLYAARPEAGAVVHAHPMFATTMSCLRRGIPAVHYMIALAGGKDVRCAEYATFGTEALSVRVLAALEGRKACLLANHGLVAFGQDLRHALRIAEEVEVVAAQYWRALQVGEPVVLDDEEMERVLERFETYGRR